MRVFIPILTGTNGEYDMIRQFEKAGAECDFVVLKNRTGADIKESISSIAAALEKAQILAFAGGDEPESNGRTAAALFKNAPLADAVQGLLARDGLILGVGSGFAALCRLGLLPGVLTANTVGRHVSTIAQIKVASTLSPWLKGVNVGDVFNVPLSTAEGRYIATQAAQIATQFAGHNPTGSMQDIEGITSADGRIFGKLGHSERIGQGLYKNICGEFDMKLFEHGVKYFN
jgi:phosphoribosylformylglycinamidine synthase